MKIISRLFVMIFTLGTLLTACNSWVYDSNRDCPQGVYLKPYLLKACTENDKDSVVVKNIKAFAFSKQDNILRGIHNIEFSQAQKIDSTFGFYFPLEYGTYWFSVWANTEDKSLESLNLTIGKSTKNDVAFVLKSEGNKATVIDTTTHIFVSDLATSEDRIYRILNPEVDGTVIDTISAPLKELTYEVKVTIEGLPSDSLDLFKPFLVIENQQLTAKGDTDYKGVDTLIVEPNIINYPPRPWKGKEEHQNLSDSTISFVFKTLSLAPNDKERLVIMAPHHTVYNNSLVGTILLLARRKGIDLTCERKLDIVFTIRDKCRCGEYMSADIRVNGWVVHSFETELGS